MQANVAACGAKIFLKIYPGNSDDMLDNTAKSICGLQPKLLSPIDNKYVNRDHLQVKCGKV